MKRFPIATGGLLLAATAAFLAAAPARTTIENDWRKVDGETWTLLANEPARHLEAAIAAYDAKDHEAAAEHLRVVSGFIELRRQTLGRAQEKLDILADQIKSGDPNATARLQEASGLVQDVMDGGRWMPAGAGLTDVIGQEPAFHFARAKAAFSRKSYESAAADIRKAAVFMRLDAQSRGGDAPAVRRQYEDLHLLAAKVAKDQIRSLSVLEREFEDARQVLQQTRG